MNKNIIVCLILVAVLLGIAQCKNRKYSEQNESDIPFFSGIAETYYGNKAASWAKGKINSCYSMEHRDGPCFDASSLVYHAWKAAGKDIQATNTRLYPGRTREVTDLKAGDILWRSGFAAIYVGDNKVVDAENEQSGVKLRDLAWFKKYIGYTKIYRPL
jgi:cell wall-associated NlpC family hydrolase